MVMCVGVGVIEGKFGTDNDRHRSKHVVLFLFAIIISLANYSCVFDGITPSY